MTGTLNFMAEDGLSATAADGLALTFNGLKPSRYAITTYHHIPPYALSSPPPVTRTPGVAPMNIFVDGGERKNREVAAGLRPSIQKPLEAPASASFTNTIDANGSATVRMVGGSASGDVWLNGLMLEELPNEPVPSNPAFYR